jgi:hypothetical protein
MEKVYNFYDALKRSELSSHGYCPPVFANGIAMGLRAMVMQIIITD